MLDVFFTVDVEVWCDGWVDIDARFSHAFRTYVYGPTVRGEYGLPFTLARLADHGLTGVFFVEPLFSGRFGIEPLQEIVQLVRDSKQEVQLHLHTEWVDEAREPLLAGVNRKRQFMRDFSLADQTTLIAAGRALLARAGGGTPNAFRAGSFGFNSDTLRALSANYMPFDSSYNACAFGRNSGIAPGATLVEPAECLGIHEYPMTVFCDGTGALRPAQLTACSSRELEGLMWDALSERRQAFVILSHNFELLNVAKNRPDDVVVERFLWLCRFLDRHRDSFRTCGFVGLEPTHVFSQPQPLRVPGWKTVLRLGEQLMRRRYG